MLRLVGDEGQDQIEAALIVILALVIVIAIFALLLPYYINVLWRVVPAGHP